jgi:hypothetical protein
MFLTRGPNKGKVGLEGAKHLKVKPARSSLQIVFVLPNLFHSS